MHPLRAYLKKNKIYIKDFAEKIGYTQQHLKNYLGKRHRISLRVAKIIEKATRGEVSAEELLAENPVLARVSQEKLLEELLI